MKAKISDIVPGRILWEVSCIDGRFCGKNNDFSAIPAKIIVIAKPTYKTGIFDKPSPFFKNEKTYFSRALGSPYKIVSENSLHDMGVGCDHVYNLHRLFTSYESALDYVEQCKAGSFKDKEDQDYYTRTSTQEYKDRREEEDEFFYSMFDMYL